MSGVTEAESTNGRCQVATPALTSVERDVLALSAEGHSVVTVAEVLGCPPETVRSAIRSALGKLGARSKLEAVVLCLRMGLIDLRAP